MGGHIVVGRVHIYNIIDEIQVTQDKEFKIGRASCRERV